MNYHLISFLIFMPLLVAFALLFVPSASLNTFRWTTLITSVLQLIILLVMLDQYQSGAIQFVEQYDWITLNLQWATLKAEYFVGVDGLSMPMVALSVVIMLIAVISSWTITKNVKGYFILLLILNAAIIGSFTALDFLLFYLFFEFMLLPMFFLIGMWGGARREYASMKFFLYTLLGSILILIVMIGLYLSTRENGSTYTFNILLMQDASNFAPESILHPDNSSVLWIWNARHWAFLFLFAGFIIKLPAVPLHTWLPDAHVEAPTPISVILAALLLKIGGYGLARIAFPIFPDAATHFGMFVGIMGVVSILYGALNALSSKDLKRLIAYSSVSHMGFVLLGFASFTTEGVTGSIYQMFTHGILSAMLFILAGVLYDRTNDRLIANYSGLASQMPSYFIFILIAFFASLGLPGLAPFIGEIMVFLGAFKSNSANGIIHESLAVIATGGLILGAAYYLWTIQRMFFGPFNLKGGVQTSSIYDLNQREYIMLVPLAVATVVFGIFPQYLLDIINPFAKEFTDAILNVSPKP